MGHYEGSEDHNPKPCAKLRPEALNPKTSETQGS